MNELERFIHKLHYRTFDKIWPHVKQVFGNNVTEEQVKEIIENRFLKNPRKLNQKKYFNKIFSSYPHAWMMDLLDNSGKTEEYKNKGVLEAKENTKEKPKFWLIFININTRFVVAYPLKNKSTNEILPKITDFVNKHKCVSLTSDKESAFIDRATTEFLKSKNISQFIVLDENHTTLSIIDSFIRHLRDRNITNEKSKYESYHSKYRNFSTKRMTQLIGIYNITPHSATGIKPIDMENNIQLERKYIAYCLLKKSKKKTYNIPINNFVRIVLKKDGLQKRRFKLSRECYKVTKKEGKNYVVSAFDNTCLILPRHRLIDLGSEKPENIKLASTIPNGKLLPQSIVNTNNHGVIVNYGNNVGSGFSRINEIRRHHPQVESRIEKDTHTIRLQFKEPISEKNQNEN